MKLFLVKHEAEPAAIRALVLVVAEPYVKWPLHPPPESSCLEAGIPLGNVLPRRRCRAARVVKVWFKSRDRKDRRATCSTMRLAEVTLIETRRHCPLHLFLFPHITAVCYLKAAMQFIANTIDSRAVQRLHTLRHHATKTHFHVCHTDWTAYISAKVTLHEPRHHSPLLNFRFPHTLYTAGRILEARTELITNHRKSLAVLRWYGVQNWVKTHVQSFDATRTNIMPVTLNELQRL
mmetsp:Transcript_40192/g.82286  ORF Transcript_40192/g.82286 Transcript_40192/m.82286 type:complete len:235 (-) Transcript_40192:584-1288(-)